MGVRVPLLPPKKLLGSFEPDFIAKRQSELSNWLRCLLNYDRVDQSAKNPHLVEEVRKFLTSKADQPPLLLDRLPLKRSSADNAAASPHSGRGLGALGVRSRRDSDTFKDFTYESPGYLESVAKKEDA
ncbi:hypothetical protein PF005_g686 [Phytophthora fragariae]|nr:hypothetical protein PF005_g686 [Phytophthora fragariae]